MKSKIKLHFAEIIHYKDAFHAIDHLSTMADRHISFLSTQKRIINPVRKKRMLDFYSKLIRPEDLCFDVGASVGLYTEVFSQLGARVVCCEPQESCLKLLHDKFDENPSVIIVPKALGESEDMGEIMINKDIPALSTLSNWFGQAPELSAYELAGYKRTKTEKVLITTLDRLVSLYGLPCYVKIDVEGFEVPVLKGLAEPVELVSFEIHGWCFQEAKKCLELLSNLGATAFNFTVHDSMKFISESWLTEEQIERRIVEKSKVFGTLLWGDVFAKVT